MRRAQPCLGRKRRDAGEIRLQAVRPQARDALTCDETQAACCFCPTGKTAKSLSSPFREIIQFSSDPNHFISLAVSSHREGRIAIVTDAGRDAMDADSTADERC